MKNKLFFIALLMFVFIPLNSRAEDNKTFFKHTSKGYPVVSGKYNTRQVELNNGQVVCPELNKYG